MEQRSLRLGDNVDDYCPRERRVTNHVIVALVGDNIRQTRCTACEAEHEYKEARVPRKKLKNGDASDLAGGVLVVPRSTPANGEAPSTAPPAAAAPVDSTQNTSAPEPDPPAAADDGDGAAVKEPVHDGWLAHRPLIRATLPRTENDTPTPRAIPEFTMHQRQGRGFGGRGFRHGFGGSGGGNGAAPPGRDGNGPDGNRAPRPGGKSRHRRRHRRPR